MFGKPMCLNDQWVLLTRLEICRLENTTAPRLSRSVLPGVDRCFANIDRLQLGIRVPQHVRGLAFRLADDQHRWLIEILRNVGVEALPHRWMLCARTLCCQQPATS